MKIVLVLSLLPYFLIAQDEVILDLTDRSITINAKTEYEYLRVDSSYNYYNHSYWGGENKIDTFFHNKKNNKT